jgi:hypothetical protein
MMFMSTALIAFWTAVTAALHGCFELLGALLGVGLATSFIVLLIVGLGCATFSAVSEMLAS